ncbi:uncharacterized protein OCT59_025814 [Rhizophagus irregularis]|uniref:uncharacterized protein n=1 Tax=Rhizophagus irregularis TaxID=588596 RepID=UPI00332669FD|nr:hypothetical protein OCT59_025814 [Rhizophagus irregularis]
MFSDKFSCGTQFDFKKLNDDEIIQFNKQIAAESEWFIDRLVRSVNCERRSYRQTCSPYSLIQQNPYFWSHVRIAVPDPKNIKHIPKFYYSNDPLLTYLKNNQIKQLNKLLGTENSSSTELWLESCRCDCKIKTYDNIYNTVSNIKNKNAITKDVKIYILQVPLLKFLPIVVALIPTRNNNAEKVFAFHQKLINIATRLDIHIISIGLDGAAT